MVVTQHRSRKKPTGSRYVAARQKRKYEVGSTPTMSKVGKIKKKNHRTKGGKIKERILDIDFINLFDPKTKKYSKSKIKTVLENKANRHFVRRNILTKGTVLETEAGKARITNRPGQEGAVNAVLIE